MKNKKVTIASATLDAAVDKSTEVVTDISMDVDNLNGLGVADGVTTLYPQDIIFENSTGSDLLFNFIRDDFELAEYEADQTNFAFIFLPNNTTLQCDKKLARSKYFILRKISTGTVTADAVIDFINYG